MLPISKTFLASFEWSLASPTLCLHVYINCLCILIFLILFSLNETKDHWIFPNTADLTSVFVWRKVHGVKWKNHWRDVNFDEEYTSLTSVKIKRVWIRECSDCSVRRGIEDIFKDKKNSLPLIMGNLQVTIRRCPLVLWNLWVSNGLKCVSYFFIYLLIVVALI